MKRAKRRHTKVTNQISFCQITQRIIPALWFLLPYQCNSVYIIFKTISISFSSFPFFFSKPIVYILSCIIIIFDFRYSSLLLIQFWPFFRHCKCFYLHFPFINEQFRSRFQTFYTCIQDSGIFVLTNESVRGR